MIKFSLGQMVKISENALRKAKREYNTVVSTTGKITSLSNDLITVRHEDGSLSIGIIKV